MAKYLDYEGLKYFIGKVKGLIGGKADKEHRHKCDEIDLVERSFADSMYLGENLEYVLDDALTKIYGNESNIKEKADKSHTHSAATKTTNGFMSARDKKIVDNLIFDTNQQAVFKIIDGKPVLGTTEV